MPPHPGSPVVGQGLRAYANGEGLRSLGHEVVYCTRREDLPASLTTTPSPKRPRGKSGTRTLARLGGSPGSPGRPHVFTETPELQSIVKDVAPDVILVESPEDTRRLPEGDFTVVLDLYAPRILEAQYQEGTEERDAVRLFDAIQRADHFLFSNERQKHFFLPLLALGGVDCTRVEGDVVPISCPPTLPKRSAPKGLDFVAGGVFWPWADLSAGLRDLLLILDEVDTGSVHLFGGKYGIRSETTRYLDPRNKLPASDRVSFAGIVPIDELWASYSKASIAFDLMAPNSERSLNLSFRQIDYLRCGLPIITSPTQVIASDLLEYEAGWCVEHGDTDALRTLVVRLMEQPKLLTAASKNAQRLAKEKYAWTKTVEPLHRFISSPVRVAHGETFLSRITREQADLWEDREANKQLRAQVSRYRSDLNKKTAELVARNRSAEEELSDWERQRQTIRDEASEAIEFSRQEKLSALVERDELKAKVDTLTAQVSLLQADVRKKSQALLKAQHDREALQEEDALRAQETWSQAEREIKKATRERDIAAESLVVLQSRVDEVSAERTNLKRGLAEAHRERDRHQKEFIETLEAAEEGARTLLETARDRAAHLDAERGGLRSKLDEAGHRLSQVERELEVAQTALLEGQTERERIRQDEERRIQQVWTQANSEVLKAQNEVSDFEDHLVRTKLRISELEADVRRKTDDLMTAEQDRERAQQEADQHLQEVWRSANAQTISAQKESQDLRNELVFRQARVEELEVELRSKEQALAAAQEERNQARQDAARQVEEIWSQAQQRSQAQEQHFVEVLAAAEERAQQFLETTRQQVSAKLDETREERGRAEGRIEELEFEVATLQEEVTKKTQELGLVLARGQEQVAGLERELSAKAEALADTQKERDQAHQEATRQVQEVWAEAELRTSAQEQRFVDVLAEAEERAQDLLDTAREQANANVEKVLEERGVATARVEELEFEVATLREEVSKKTQELEQALAQGQEQVAELERELSAKAEALASTQEERDQAHEDASRQAEEGEQTATRLQKEATQHAARVEELEYEVRVLGADVEKKAAELVEVQRQGQRLAELEADAVGRLAALESQEKKLAAQSGLIEQLKYEVEALGREVEKKTDELEAAHAQRDAANAEKAALEAFLGGESQSSFSESSDAASDEAGELPEA